MNLELLVTLGVFAPLLGAAVAGFFGRRIGNIPSQAVTTGLLFFSCAVAWTVFGQWTWGHLEAFTVELAPFITVGDFKSVWSIRVDALSATMLIVVTTVSSLVHLYSWGYMAEDDSRPRFFAYLSLFTFMMLALVTAADFMQIFFGWEGVGLASYLLIGFWFKKPTASAAAIKAFVVNRVGDFGFVLGIITIYWMFGTINFAELFPMIETRSGTTWEFLGHQWSALDLAGVLLFIGAMGKSAQFFLHTWLPDAMEGPTPVSALIHAATMVTAGVYMVCLLSPIYEHAPTASLIITVIGGITALFAATVGMMQNDIKRVIAYSTCSQLGYMFFAAGVGAYQGAMFHLFTHAFFKALLFLGAGSVIHGMHHEQDMRKMGGLWKLLPVTYAVMMIGTIAITGLGLPGVGGFAGFYSKDSIIESAFAAASSGHSPAGYFVFFIGIFAALLTSYYSWRLIFMTFHNKPVWAGEGAHGHDDHGHAHDDHHHADAHAADAHDDHAHDDHHHHGPLHPHESPPSMVVPLLVLSIGAVFAGMVFYPQMVGHHWKEFWGDSIAALPREALHNETIMEAAHHVPFWVPLAPTVMGVSGIGLAYVMYVLAPDIPGRLAARFQGVYQFLLNKWYFDELYDAIFVRPAHRLARLLWQQGDMGTIDRLGPDGIAAVSRATATAATRLQTGQLAHYAFAMLIGVLVLVTLFVARGN